jgi:predicted  nucleic acid-binding Zn-ribbon protein
MTLSDPRFWLDAFLVVLTGINTAVVWLRRPGEEAKQSIQSLGHRIDDELGELTSRLAVVEQRMAHMPTDEELATLRGDVQQVKAVVEGQRDLLKRVEHQQTLILEQLLQRSK